MQKLDTKTHAFLGGTCVAMRTQDNRITADPVFAVERKVRDWGYEEDYADGYKWIDFECGDYTHADEKQSRILDLMEDQFRDTGKWRKGFYVDRWEFVTACFTEQGCKEYLRQNGHNLGETRIYVHSAYRNVEWKKLRKFLLEFNETVGREQA